MYAIRSYYAGLKHINQIVVEAHQKWLAFGVAKTAIEFQDIDLITINHESGIQHALA